MEIIMTLTKLEGNVLIVDDSTDTLKFLAEAIEPSGANILIAMTGEKALEVVNEIIPDVILLDAIMPGMSGFETCKLLKVDSSTLWRWTNKGKVIAYGIGSRRFYKKEELLESLIKVK